MYVYQEATPFPRILHQCRGQGTQHRLPKGKIAKKKAYFIKVVFLKKWSKQSSPGPGKEMEQRENSQKFEVQAKLGNKKTCPPCP